MSPVAQRIAIAEACGYEKEACYYIEKQGKVSIDSLLKNYLSDLNAMHEAEKVLTSEQRFLYLEHLTQSSSYNRVFASAAQRAEAFLRTLNLWDDSK